MPTQYAAGVIIFLNQPAQDRSWLLIRHAAGHWELPKGHVEPGENWRTTALRELAEETGITDAKPIPDFARTIRYTFRDKKKGIVQKVVTFALAEAFTDQIKLSREHTHFAFLNFDLAIHQLTHAGTRALLRDAADFLALRKSP